MILVLLNICVDSQDPIAFQFKENTAINDQESIIEIVVEKLLGYENAIAEYDDVDGDQSQQSTGKNVSVELCITHPSPFIISCYKKLNQDYFHQLKLNPHPGYLSISSPPPRV